MNAEPEWSPGVSRTDSLASTNCDACTSPIKRAWYLGNASGRCVGNRSEPTMLFREATTNQTNALRVRALKAMSQLVNIRPARMRQGEGKRLASPHLASRRFSERLQARRTASDPRAPGVANDNLRRSRFLAPIAFTPHLPSAFVARCSRLTDYQ